MLIVKLLLLTSFNNIIYGHKFGEVLGSVSHFEMPSSFGSFEAQASLLSYIMIPNCYLISLYFHNIYCFPQLISHCKVHILNYY